MLHTYVLVTICDVATYKCCHCCDVNVATTVCNAAANICYVNVAYVLIIRCDVAASNVSTTVV